MLNTFCVVIYRVLHPKAETDACLTLVVVTYLLLWLVLGIEKGLYTFVCWDAGRYLAMDSGSMNLTLTLDTVMDPGISTWITLGCWWTLMFLLQDNGQVAQGDPSETSHRAEVSFLHDDEAERKWTLGWASAPSTAWHCPCQESQ